MTSTNQPLPHPAATITTPRDRETNRLITLWSELTLRTVAAEAHHSPEEDSLRHLQGQVEEAITDHLIDCDSVLNELYAWEAGLTHESEAPPDNCLLCRKARLELPADLPIPVLQGASR